MLDTSQPFMIGHMSFMQVYLLFEGQLFWQTVHLMGKFFGIAFSWQTMLAVKKATLVIASMPFNNHTLGCGRWQDLVILCVWSKQSMKHILCMIRWYTLVVNVTSVLQISAISNATSSIWIKIRAHVNALSKLWNALTPIEVHANGWFQWVGSWNHLQLILNEFALETSNPKNHLTSHMDLVSRLTRRVEEEIEFGEEVLLKNLNPLERHFQSPNAWNESFLWVDWKKNILFSSSSLSSSSPSSSSGVDGAYFQKK